MYKKTVLDNGLRVITETMPYLKSATMGIWADVGSRNETPEINGLSHFIEHMVFKGTRTRSALEIATALESLGGSLNAFTSRENTCFYARVLDQHVPVATEILCDLLANSTFEEKHLRMERKVIVEEIKDSLDTPSDYVHDLHARAMWRKHPLGYPILGSATRILRTKRETLLSFYRKNYVTSNMVVAASGNVNHARLVRQISEQLRLRMSRRKNPPKLKKPVNYRARKVYGRDIMQAHIVLGWEIVPYKNYDRYPLLMLNNILGGGMSSRFFQAIREKMGLAYTIYSYQDYYKDSGIFGTYVGCDSKNVVPSVNLLLHEVDKIKQNGIDDAEFTATRVQLTGNLMLGLESSTNRMNRLARNELYMGRFFGLNETLKNLEKVQREDLTRVARRYLNPENLTMVVLGPLDKTVLGKIEL